MIDTSALALALATRMRTYQICNMFTTGVA